jgi:hypothetical protein
MSDITQMTLNDMLAQLNKGGSTDGGGFLVPQEWVEAFSWLSDGGSIDTYDLPETWLRRIKRYYAHVSMFVNRWMYRLVYQWRPFCWLPHRLWIRLPAAYRWADKPSRTLWTKDGKTYKVQERL